MVAVVLVIHLQEIDTVVKAMAGVDVEYPGALNIGVCRIFRTLIMFYLGILLVCF